MVRMLLMLLSCSLLDIERVMRMLASGAAVPALLHGVSRAPLALLGALPTFAAVTGAAAAAADPPDRVALCLAAPTAALPLLCLVCVSCSKSSAETSAG